MINLQNTSGCEMNVKKIFFRFSGEVEVTLENGSSLWLTPILEITEGGLGKPSFSAKLAAKNPKPTGE